MSVFMVAEFTYISLLTIFIILPAIVLALFNLKTVMRYRLVILGTYVILPVLWLWDYLATTDRVWYFINILGIWILGIPVEEILFITFLILFVSSVTIILLRKRK